jgi:hypothetical protein
VESAQPSVPELSPVDFDMTIMPARIDYPLSEASTLNGLGNGDFEDVKAVEPLIREPDRIDFDMTIMPGRIDYPLSEPSALNGPGSEDFRDVRSAQPLIHEPGPIDFGLTIIPRGSNYPLTEVSDEPSEFNNQIHWETEEQLSKDPKPSNIGEGLPQSLFEIREYEDDQLPRAIPPVLLAAGVILAVLVIAVGVYYSRLSQ